VSRRRGVQNRSNIATKTYPLALASCAQFNIDRRRAGDVKDQPPKRDREMIELGVVFALSVAMLIAVMVTVWIVGIKT
jgi:hypothetical protein